MTLPEAPPPRKRRGPGIATPFVVLAIAAAGYSAGWLWLRQETSRQLDAGAAELRSRGYTVSWRDRTIGGYPFRLDVDFSALRLAEPGGWAVAFPRLRSESFVYALGHWVAEAPDGVTITRPGAGAVRVRAEVLHASLAGLSEHPPRFSLEGQGLTFTPEAGARPFPLASAQGLQFHLRQGPDDEGGLFVSLTGGRPLSPPPGLGGDPQGGLDFNLELILSKAHALVGPDWSTAGRAWSAAGGTARLRRGSISSGRTTVTLSSPQPMTTGTDGRLRGALQGDLSVTPPAGTAPAATSPPAATPAPPLTGRVTFEFRDGQTLVNGLPVAPAPRLY